MDRLFATSHSWKHMSEDFGGERQHLLWADVEKLHNPSKRLQEAVFLYWKLEPKPVDEALERECDKPKGESKVAVRIPSMFL